MINAKDLRIGNYVMDKVSGEWMVVDEIGENVGAVLINRDKYPLPTGWQMSGIPLMPDILIKANFRKVGDYPVFRLKTLQLSMNPEGIFIFFTGSNNIKIKSLHQLQNLYFALYEEELVINL